MNKKEDNGSALIMGIILMSFLAILSMTLFSLTGDTINHTQRVMYKNNSSLIADTTLQKVKYDINDAFMNYYKNASSATASLDWFTSSTVSGVIGETGYIYRFPTAGLPSNYLEDTPAEWNDARFEVTYQKTADTDPRRMRDFTITASAYYLDSNNKEINGTRSTIQEVISFGFQTASASEYLIHTGGPIELYGPGTYLGEVKSNTQLISHHIHGHGWPTVLGSLYSSGSAYSQNHPTRFIRNVAENSTYYRRTHVYPQARPFQPSVIIRLQNYTEDVKNYVGAAETTTIWRNTPPVTPPRTPPIIVDGGVNSK